MEAHSFARSDGGRTLPRSRKLLAAIGDERLVAQLRRGNEAAFEVLYDRHHAAVLSYCRHMLGSRDEAEDALQQAFISAHADIVSSDKPIRFKAWIYTIARNRCLSVLRSRRERPSEEIDAVSAAGLSEEVQRRADLRELLADMQELPDDQRDALILSELGDLSHAEVAEVIDCEVAKVKSLVFQARSGLLERREARETPCSEIREQVATLRGGSLRRGPLRRHLKACPGCAEFREEVRRQRQAFAALLPVVPTVALKENALAAVGISAGSATTGALAGGGGAGALLVAKTGVAKVAMIAVTTTGVVGGAVVVEQAVVEKGSRDRAGQPAAEGAAPGAAVTPSSRIGAAAPGMPGASHAGGADGPAAAGAAAMAGIHGKDGARPGGAPSGEAIAPGRHAAPGENGQGFEPVQGESNGGRAQEFAPGRGPGGHSGAEKQNGNEGASGRANAGQKPAKSTPQRSESVGQQGAGAKPEATEKPSPGKPDNAGSPAKPEEPENPFVPLIPAPGLVSPVSGEGQGQPDKDGHGKGAGKKAAASEAAGQA
jgi:RNA polymerase sigma factor (sigma-70 family)